VNPGSGIVEKDLAGHHYRFSCPQAVNGKCVYELEVKLAAPLPATQVAGATQELLGSLTNRYGDAEQSVRRADGEEPSVAGGQHSSQFSTLETRFSHYRRQHAVTTIMNLSAA
jgi:hypothetical protein